MKNSLKITLVICIAFLGFTSTTQAQDFRDVLGTAYLTQSSQNAIINMTYGQLNNELFSMTDISFSREIRAEKKENAVIGVDDNQDVAKAKYVKTLRDSANKTEVANSFSNKAYQRISAL